MIRQEDEAAAAVAGPRRSLLLGLAAVPLLLGLTVPGEAEAAARRRRKKKTAAAARTSTTRSRRLAPSAGAALTATTDRTLVLHHMRTGERLQVAYFADGVYQPGEMAQVDRLLRDWREDRTTPTDPRLLDLLWSLHRGLECGPEVQVLCGYRTPETNAMLRRISEGVARNSLHMRGMAIDLRIPGRTVRQVRAAALRLRRGGVGYYPRAGFVHVDTGPVRAWGGRASV